MEFDRIVKVIETTDPKIADLYLGTSRWIILSVAPGQTESGNAYNLYSLGWYGPYDPECPENDTTEFPKGTERVVEIE